MAVTAEQVGVREAKSRFSEIAARVNADGIDVLVLRNNKPWVRIVPATPSPAERLESFDAFVSRLSGQPDLPWPAGMTDREILNEARVRRFG